MGGKAFTSVRCGEIDGGRPQDHGAERTHGVPQQRNICIDVYTRSELTRRITKQPALLHTMDALCAKTKKPLNAVKALGLGLHPGIGIVFDRDGRFTIVLCMCACMYVSCIYACIMHVCMHVCLYVCMDVCVFVCLFVCHVLHAEPQADKSLIGIGSVPLRS